MKSLPNKYILLIKPKEYMVQEGPGHCGAYSVKGILSAVGKDSKDHPKEYHLFWLGRLTGGTFGKNYWINVLEHYGINAEFKTAKDLPSDEKINLLKTLLNQETPVMIRIGNGYFRSNKYNPKLGKIITHWITLWGYDERKKVFYVYDSGLTKNLYDKSIPTGNTKRTYDQILRDWSFGQWQPWCWYISSESYSYIKIKKLSKN